MNRHEMQRQKKAEQLLEQKSIDVRGRRVLYQVTGSGDPLVLLHGLSGSTRWWWRNIPELSRDYRVYLVDFPGFGSMRRDQAGFALSEAAEWLARWIIAMNITPVHLVAHSLGGFIAVRLAARNSQLLDRLVLVSPAGVPDDRPLLAYTVPLLRAARQLRPRFAMVLANDFLRAGPRTIIKAARELLSEDIREDLTRIDRPTLLIWGADDPMVPASVSRVYTQCIDRSRLVVLPDTGHVPMIDRASEFNDVVLRFLEGESVGQ